MKTYTKEELAQILDSHKKWLNGDFSGSLANLSGANLSRANLSLANLSGANLSLANLSGANLSLANLSGADLSGANLSRANLSGANLSLANLSGADLSGANLSGADLSRANLSGADLSRANLSRADLSRANLSGADLSRANLSLANLSGANLSGVRNAHIPLSCPETGSFIGFKKCANSKIVKLRIPETALRSSGTGRKCRCSEAFVVEIQNLDGSKSDVNVAYSIFNPKFIYVVGEHAVVDDFDTNRFNECSAGIHFFITRQEAADY
jgi:hypothetical protein